MVTSDLHGVFGAPSVGTDLRLIEAAIRKKQQEGHVILIDNGDILQGSASLAYFSKKAHMHPVPFILNELRYDVVVPGNHDFDYGKDTFDQVRRQTNCPWICANLVDKTTKQPYLQPYEIIEKGDYTICIIGVTITLPFSHPSFDQANLMITIEYETVKTLLPTVIKEHQPDVIVVSYHGGLDTSKGHEHNVGEQIAAIQEVDVLITGHQHELRAEVRPNGPVIIQPGALGERIGYVTLSGQKKKEWRRHASLLQPEDFRHNISNLLTQKLEPYHIKAANWLDESIATVHVDGKGKWSDEGIPLSENGWMQWVHTVMQKEGNAAISFVSLSHDVEKKDMLTNEQLHHVYAYPDHVYTYVLEEKEIKALLEITASIFVGQREPSHPFRKCETWLTPHDQSYQFMTAGGVEYVIDVRKPVGKRVTIRHFTNSASHHHVAVSTFIAQSAPKYAAIFEGKRPIYRSEQSIPELLRNDAEKTRNVQITSDDNWSVVTSC